PRACVRSRCWPRGKSTPSPWRSWCRQSAGCSTRHPSMDRSNHYEAAFEGYLRARRLGYVAVDETHRASLDDEPVKSLDFVVYGSGTRLLVDVKGRRFPGGPKDRPRRVWESWSTREDVDGLERWAERFGPDYLPLLVFAYQIR